MTGRWLAATMSQPDVAVSAMPEAEARPPITAARLIPGAVVANASSMPASWPSGGVRPDSGGRSIPGRAVAPGAGVSLDGTLGLGTRAAQLNPGVGKVDQVGPVGDHDDGPGPRESTDDAVRQCC